MAVGDKGSKRKAKRDPDESDDDEEFEEKPQFKQNDSDDGSEAETKPKKKAKKAEPADEDEGEAGARRGESSNTQYDDDGRPYFLVGPRKRITLSEFKGKEYINIREYYTDKADGKDKPGKKGITLDLDQWTLLKSKTSLIDSWISDSSSKPPKAKAARGKK